MSAQVKSYDSVERIDSGNDYQRCIHQRHWRRIKNNELLGGVGLSVRKRVGQPPGSGDLPERRSVIDFFHSRFAAWGLEGVCRRKQAERGVRRAEVMRDKGRIPAPNPYGTARSTVVRIAAIMVLSSGYKTMRQTAAVTTPLDS
eukprot:scaffold13847_cov99-Skeletonema_dohrnii-CCMP3373.AAC.4